MSYSVLELQGLNKSFGAVRATRDLSFLVKACEIHALIGPNGAGKTTVVQQIYGALKPDVGRVLFNGRDISNLPVPDRVRAGIGRKILDWSLWGKCRNDFQAGVQLSAQRLFTDGCIQVTQIMPEEIA